MHVMVVDPNRTILDRVTRLLEARNHQVVPFQDGPEALDYIANHTSVEALLTGTELASMSGTEMCRKVRILAGKRRPIYILLMSASHERHNLIDVLAGDADDFIDKPPNAEELFARLRAAERLGSMQRDLLRMTTTDPLTGVLNRRAFFEVADNLCRKADNEPALSAIMIDIDHFKEINGIYGHDVGDEVIRRVASQAAQEDAIVGRLGGEEFAMLLLGKALTETVAVAEGLRTQMMALRMETEQGEVSLTCSFGVSTWKVDDNIDQLLRRADIALYVAKSSGRNRVISASGANAERSRLRTGSVIRAQVRPDKSTLN